MKKKEKKEVIVLKTVEEEAKAFLEDVKVVQDKHGFDIIAELEMTVSGIIPVPKVTKRKK